MLKTDATNAVCFIRVHIRHVSSFRCSSQAEHHLQINKRSVLSGKWPIAHRIRLQTVKASVGL